MTEHCTSSVLVVEKSKLIGIITERDLVSRVISEKKNGNTLASEVMTKNPMTISKYAYYYEALSAFFINGVKHLPVVENDKLLGIITLSNVLRHNKDSMMRTIKTIEAATHETLPSVKMAIYDVVDALLQDDVPIFKVLDSVTRLYDRLVKRCIEMAIEALSKREGLLPPTAFCFYQMGSAGREEQFLLTDQDHFLVYDNNSPEIENYFSKLGEEIVHLLEKAGYARCLGEMMASNPNWRGSLETWMSRIQTWSTNATNQNMLLAQNFFSYRYLYGDENLHKEFEARLLQQMKNAKIFLYRLHEQDHHIPSLDHPIRALFKLDRKQLDIKKEILFPYHHCLQILSVEYGIISGTPFERIDRLVEKKAFSASFGKDVKAAASDVMRNFVKQRWCQYKNKEKLTSVLHFSHLTTKEKEELILSVKILKEIQTLVNAHFQI
jgi:CBS domain-containing protein